jgi:hypothetical protein
MSQSRWSYVHLAAAVLIGLAAGRFMFNDAATVRALQARLKETDRSGAPKRSDGGSGFTKGRTATGRPAKASPAHEEDLLSEEEQALTSELIERAKQGEYILHYEYPEARKRIQLAIDQIVSQRAAADAQDYGAAFRELGIDPKKAENLVKHVEKIHRAAREAEIEIQQLLFARREYQHRIESVLSPEDVQRYQEYEQSKNARRELESMRKFALKQNIPFDPAWEAPLANTIASAQAFTERNGYGPLDPIPNYSTDRDVLVKQIESDIALASQGFQKLAQTGPNASLPRDSQELLTRYYADRIQQKRQMIEGILSPPKPAHD